MTSDVNTDQLIYSIDELKQTIMDVWEKIIKFTLSALANSVTDCAIQVLKAKAATL